MAGAGGQGHQDHLSLYLDAQQVGLRLISVSTKVAIQTFSDIFVVYVVVSVYF